MGINSLKGHSWQFKQTLDLLKKVEETISNYPQSTSETLGDWFVGEGTSLPTLRLDNSPLHVGDVCVLASENTSAVVYAYTLQGWEVLSDLIQRAQEVDEETPLSPPVISVVPNSITPNSVRIYATGVLNALISVYVNGELTTTGSIESEILVNTSFIGTLDIHATQSLGGETSLTSNVVTVTLPKVLAPVVSLVTDSTTYDSGSVLVTGQSGATVTVYLAGVQYATGVSGDTFTVTGLTQSTANAVTATQTVGGETSALSAAVTITTAAVPNVTHSVVDVTDTTIDLSFANLISGASINVTVGGSTTTITDSTYQITGQTAESIVNISYTQTVNGQTSASTPFSVTMDAAELVETVSIPAEIELPTILSDLEIYRQNGVVTCNKTPADLIDMDQFINEIYVDNTVVSSGNGATSETALKTISEAFVAANASGAATKIIIEAGTYAYAEGLNTGNVEMTATVPLSIEAVNGTVQTGAFDDQTWVQDSTYPAVYSTNRTVCYWVVDPSATVDSIPVSYTRLDYAYNANQATVLAELAATPGSWWTDRTTVWVHAHDSGVVSDSNARAIYTSRNWMINHDDDFYAKDINVIGGAYGAIKLTSTNGAKAVLERCSGRFACTKSSSGTHTAYDGIQKTGGSLLACFNCDTSGNSKDGFNMNSAGSYKPFFFGVNNTSYDNGKITTNVNSSNGLTTHNGCSGIDLGGTYLRSLGTNVGIINDGTTLLCVGTTAGDSNGDIPNGGVIDFGAFGAWSGAAKLWLDGCTDQGANIGTYGADGGVVYIKNHTGTGTQVGTETY